MVTSDGGIRRAVFFAYNGLHEILAEAEQNVRWNNDAISRRPLILNSHVISASLAMGRHKQLLRQADSVRVTLRHLRTGNVSDPVCVFWDYEHSAWSDDGCEVRPSLPKCRERETSSSLSSSKLQISSVSYHNFVKPSCTVKINC